MSLADVDGIWSKWNPWSSCTVTCGGGVQVRQRTCDNPAPSGKGKKCEGPDEGTRLCSQNPCPIRKKLTRPALNVFKHKPWDS